jgi:hypothetical protein
MNPEQQQEILNLRGRNLTSKQIARKLGLKVAEVTAVIKEQAQETTLARAAAGELDPIAECLVNASSAEKFLGIGTTQQTDDEDTDEELGSGLALVSVARQVAVNRVTVCTYMVDLWCLGVKDTIGPRKLDQTEYKQLMDAIYRGFPDGTQNITLEQAQALVFSAVDYAAQLGFSPHPDFEQSRPHLGEWSGEPKIECGRNGKPFYMSGPYDNPLKILKTLREKVGEGNFDYLTEVG